MFSLLTVTEVPIICFTFQGETGKAGSKGDKGEPGSPVSAKQLLNYK